MPALENSATENSVLSERELEILRLVATGASNKEIARQLFISANTVKVHLRNIFAKIGATSRTEAALYAVRAGLVHPVPSAAIPGQVEAGGEKPSEAGDVRVSEFVQELEQTPRPRSPRVLFWVATGCLVFLLMAGLGWIVFKQRPVMLAGDLQATPTVAPRWRELASMPTARHSFASAVYEDDIFAIGGEGLQGVIGVVERFDPPKNTWAVLTPKPAPVADVGAAVVGGLIYVPGGRTATGKITDILEVYDPRSDRWERRSSLPEALSAYSLVAYEGRIYVIGGWNGKEYLNSVYAYDPSRDSWSSYSPMPTARGYAGVAEVGGKIYIMGGFDGARALTVNEVYYPDRDDGSGRKSWEKATPLPIGCYAVGTASLADSIYVAGGEGCEGNKPVFLMYAHIPDSWQALDNTFSQPFSHAGLVSLGSQVYIFGGRLEDLPSAQNLAYQAIYTISIPIVR